MRLNLTLYQKAIVLISFPLVFQILFVGTLVTLLHQAEHEREKVAHARDVQVHINSLLRMLIEMGSASVINHRHRDTSWWNHTRREMDVQLRDEAYNVKSMVANDPDEREAFKKVENLLIQATNELHASQGAADQQNEIEQMLIWRKMQKVMRTLFDESDQLVIRQVAIQDVGKKTDAIKRAQIEYVLFGFVGFNILLAGALAAYFHKATGSRFERLIQNTVLLASQKPLNAPLTGSDELAHLDKFFHHMESALKEAKQKETAIVENAVDVICSIDSDGRFIEVNPAAMKVWRYRPVDLVGTRLSNILAQDDIPTTLQSIKDIVTEQTQRSFEARVKRRDGSLVDMLWSANWSNEEMSLFCVAHDITERKQVERMKQDFLAMVSHDLRTPLTSVQAFLSLLSVDAYGEISVSGKESLEMTENNVSRLISMINDLLDIEKMESGMLELSVEPVEVEDIVSRSLHAVSGFAAQQSIKLDTGSVSETIVDADGDRIVQVVVNLLSNAIKFSPKNGTVTVTVEETPKFVQINIIDHGRGVPEKMRETIFERFKQVEKDDERKKGGSGLGLAICKAIIERHNGAIGVSEGKDGIGSNFWFKLPRKAVISDSEAA